jgi:hypothetical protein
MCVRLRTHHYERPAYQLHGQQVLNVCVCEEKKSDDFSMHANLKTQET